jgi:DNA-binding GntR family transcriptional regulator
VVRRITARPSLVDLAHDALVDAIFEGSLAAGAQVSIDDLAERLGISTTPVREALVRATSERLLTVELNKGYRVAPMLTTDEYRQLFQLRSLLERHAAGSATIGPADVEQLVAAIERMRTFVESDADPNPIEFSRADRDFHAVIVASARDAFVYDAWSNLHVFMHAHRLYARIPMTDWQGSADEAHAAILDAARRGDCAALADAVDVHAMSAGRALVELRSTLNA